MLLLSRLLAVFCCTGLCFSGLIAQNSFQKIYEDSGSNIAHAVIQADGSNYILAGSYQSLASPSTPRQPWLAKVDASGTVLWRKVYPMVQAGNFNLVTRTHDGGYLAVGYMAVVSGHTQNCVVKTDADGNWQWGKVFIHPFSPEAVQTVADGYILTAGVGVLLKLDNLGNISWQAKYGALIKDFMVLADTIYAVGTYNDYRSLYTMSAEDGTIYSAKIFPDTASNHSSFLEQLRVTADGNLLVSGMQSDGSVTVQKISKSGTVLMSKRLYRDGGRVRLLLAASTAAGGAILGGFLPATIDADQLEVLVKLDSTLGLEAAAQYPVSGYGNNYYQLNNLQAPDGGILFIHQPENTYVALSKARSNLEIDGCCAAPLPLKIVDLPVTVQDFTLTTNSYGEALQAILSSTELRPYPGQDYCPTLPQADTLAFCPGDSVQIGGRWYTHPGTVIDTALSLTSCDTITTYTLVLLDQQVNQDRLITLCANWSVLIGGHWYTPPATVIDTTFSLNSCTTITTYTVQAIPLPAENQLIEFCAGDSVLIGGHWYTQPGTVIDTVYSMAACDTVRTYTLQVLPQPTKNQLIEFCPGDTVMLHGVMYTQPGTVITTLPATLGCDTLVTYVLAFNPLPSSTISVQCPANLTVSTATNEQSAVVDYPAATGVTNCPCGTMSLDLTQGLSSGGTFPLGPTQVCYQATDACNSSASCCFMVTVDAVVEAAACDVKNTACVKFEILDIFQNPAGQKTYRFRVTNPCANPLLYTTFQLPDGLLATAPADNTIYTATSGRRYTVRNANASPAHSVRFKSIDTGMANGQSDVFTYTLQPQTAPLYIYATARLEGGALYEAHLNVFGCTVQPTLNRTEAVQNRPAVEPALRVFPNPFTDQLTVAFELDTPTSARVILTDLTGRLVLVGPESQLEAGSQQVSWQTGALANGAYLVGLKTVGSGWIYRKVMLLR